MGAGVGGRGGEGGIGVLERNKKKQLSPEVLVASWSILGNEFTVFFSEGAEQLSPEVLPRVDLIYFFDLLH